MAYTTTSHHTGRKDRFDTGVGAAKMQWSVGGYSHLQARLPKQSGLPGVQTAI